MCRVLRRTDALYLHNQEVSHAILQVCHSSANIFQSMVCMRESRGLHTLKCRALTGQGCQAKAVFLSTLKDAMTAYRGFDKGGC